MSEKKKPEEPSTLIKSEGSEACGCYVVVYSDDRSIVTPCAPHGLLGAARALQEAAAALNATANGLVRREQQSTIMQAVKEAGKK